MVQIINYFSVCFRAAYRWSANYYGRMKLQYVKNNLFSIGIGWLIPSRVLHFSVLAACLYFDRHMQTVRWLHSRISPDRRMENQDTASGHIFSPRWTGSTGRTFYPSPWQQTDIWGTRAPSAAHAVQEKVCWVQQAAELSVNVKQCVDAETLSDY